MRNFIGFKTLVEREIVRFTSVFVQTLFPPLVSSFLYIAVFGMMIGGQIPDVGGSSYVQFLIPGLIMMYLIESAYTNTSSSLFIARWSSHIQEILVSPLSYFEMVLAFLIGGLVRSFVIAFGVYLISLIFAPTPIQHPLVVLTISILVSLTFSSIGAVVALIAEEFEHLSICTTFVITPLVFLGGVFHSVDMIPNRIQVITRYNPIFYMMSGIRYGMLGTSEVPVGTSLMVVFALFLLLFSFTVYLFRSGYKLRK